MSVTIGIDLGGTNLRAAAYRDLAPAEQGQEAPRPVAQQKTPVGDDRDPHTIVERIAATVESLTEEAGASPDEPVLVGIGIAAMLSDGRGHVARSPHLDWDDVPFGDLLRARLGRRHPLCVTNDVNAITFGEWGAGAGRGARDVLAVYVGTGIGAGFVCDGRLIDGASNCAGEIGHFKVVWDEHAAPCACGGRGCVEAYVGGTYLQKRARLELSSGLRSKAVTLAGSWQQVTPGHLDEAAADGDDYALTLFSQVAPLLGVTLANAVALLNPAKLILGGGVLSRTPVLRAHVITAFDLAVPRAVAGAVTICDAELGDDAGLVGSALLARASG